MSDLNEKRELNRGFGDGMSRAFELAVTPLVFGLIGWAIDSWLGTSPLFAIALALFAVVAQLLRIWYGYDAEMRAHESQGRWNRTTPRPRVSAAETSQDLWTVRRGDRGSEERMA